MSAVKSAKQHQQRNLMTKPYATHGTEGLVIPMKNPRYETCIQCGEKWNVSAHAKLFRGKYYVCPKCESKNRRARA